jgi:hypothetical protein
LFSIIKLAKEMTVVYQIVVRLDFDTIRYSWDCIVCVEDTCRRSRPIIEEEHDENFKKTIDGDFASYNNRSFGMLVVVFIEVLSGVEKSFYFRCRV